MIIIIIMILCILPNGCCGDEDCPDARNEFCMAAGAESGHSPVVLLRGCIILHSEHLWRAGDKPARVQYI